MGGLDFYNHWGRIGRKQLRKLISIRLTKICAKIGYNEILKIVKFNTFLFEFPPSLLTPPPHHPFVKRPPGFGQAYEALAYMSACIYYRLESAVALA